MKVIKGDTRSLDYGLFEGTRLWPTAQVKDNAWIINVGTLEMVLLAEHRLRRKLL